MTHRDGQAPAGWYDDPHMPGRMRYFDGELWTDHYHHPGKLPSIGAWASATFGALRANPVEAFALAAGVSLVGNLIVWVGLRQALSDLAVVEGDLVNAGSTTIVVGFVAVLGAVLWQGFGWLALNRYLQRAHFHDNPTITEALQRAASRLPRLIGLMIALTAAGVLALVVLALVFAVSLGLGVLISFVGVIAMIWVLVKLSFLPAAIVAAPADESAIRASANVSKGRFWPVLGRLLLAGLAIGLAGNIIGGLAGGVGSPVDQDRLADVFEVDGDEVFVRDFAFDDILPSGGDFALYIVFSTIVGAATSLVSTSAFMRLYLDSGAPSEL